jgi:hypothetical protein
VVTAAADIIDACVVEGAMRRHDLIVSSDECDLQVIAAAVSRHLETDHPQPRPPAAAAGTAEGFPCPRAVRKPVVMDATHVVI